MSLLGFDAIGRWALGAFPDTTTVTIMSADVGSFSFNGKAAAFALVSAMNAGSFSLTGNAAPLISYIRASAAAYVVSVSSVRFEFNDHRPRYQQASGARGASYWKGRR